MLRGCRHGDAGSPGRPQGSGKGWTRGPSSSGHLPVALPWAPASCRGSYETSLCCFLGCWGFFGLLVLAGWGGVGRRVGLFFLWDGRKK